MPIQFKAPTRFDAAQVAFMRAEIERLATASDNVVIDLGRTEALDGSGVGAMVYAFKRLEARGLRLSIRSASGQPLDLLHASGLLRTLSGETRESFLAVLARSVRLGRLFPRAPRQAPAPATAFDANVSARNSGERAA